MDLVMEDCASDEISPASISKKLKQDDEGLASVPGSSSEPAGSGSSVDQLKSSTSDLNNLNASDSDMSYHDDEDGEEAGDDDAYYSDYDDYDKFSYNNDEYTNLQSQFDHVDLPTGVEVSLPWLKDPAPSENTSGKKTGFSDLPESKIADAAACSSTAHAESSSNNKVEETEESVMQKFEHFKRFDVVDDFSDHHYSRMGFSDTQPPKSWAKRIQEEWKILENDLPETIYVRVYEARMELLRAVIIGPSGTPYHDGLFVFDCLFPTEYPKTPPMVYYYSGGLRLNPNLYECGKVCLSLLGTWSGHNNENWVPGNSTMLQVLVSIQALILNEKPFFNEPGYERTYTGADGESRSNKYNEDAFILSLKTMVYTLRRPPKYFEDLVAGHFRQRAHQILLSCKSYYEGVLVGSDINNRAQTQVPDTSTRNFKASVVRMMNMLITSFTKNGSTDCEQYKLPV